jgi:hypothetical protein
MCHVTHVEKITYSTSCITTANHVTMATITSVCAASALAKGVDTGSDSVGPHGYVTNDKLLLAGILQAVNALMR